MSYLTTKQFTNGVLEGITFVDCTLEARGSDSLDFSERAVWNIRAALEAAYRAGYEAGVIA
jgi:hypothetical protein